MIIWRKKQGKCSKNLLYVYLLFGGESCLGRIILHLFFSQIKAGILGILELESCITNSLQYLCVEKQWPEKLAFFHIYFVIDPKLCFANIARKYDNWYSFILVCFL